MTALTGMKQICQYFGYSEVTILKLIRERDFPAEKVTGGIWQSTSELIEEWRIRQIKGGTEKRKRSTGKKSGSKAVSTKKSKSLATKSKSLA